MFNILLTLTVLCQGPVPTFTKYAETSSEHYEHDLQLVRMGWYDANNDRRCRAVQVKYTKGVL